MSVRMIGIDHNKADLDVRGIFSFTKKKTEEAYRRFLDLPGVSGTILLSTCNRMEWWLSVDEETGFSMIDTLCSFLNLNPEQYRSYFTERNGREAVEHLFRLTAGLKSQILGEDQILTQVGDAQQFARANSATDHTLEVLFRLALTSGKRVKTETDLSSADNTIIHAALDKLKAQGFDTVGKKCMVIGNGMMGKLSALALMERGADVTVTVRQYTSGLVDIPKGCRRIGYMDRYELLPSCDLVVSATSSPNFTLSRKEMEKLVPDQPVYVVDLAVPRDVEPGIGELPAFRVFDVDSFRISRMTEKLRRNISKAEEILAEEIDEFYDWYTGKDLFPKIQELKKTAAENVCLRMTSFFRKSAEETGPKELILQEAGGASERMMNHLLFGMRSRLSDDVFRECVDAMEAVFRDGNDKSGK
uniref:glutamyl-tRNA reductase n=1 Tax=Eubacterium cellulosolvens TaxID=29322 RepID=UPI000480449D|nr:glutamyl-tRNA reductase [[Eubacterium] cellulosolvens]